MQFNGEIIICFAETVNFFVRLHYFSHEIEISQVIYQLTLHFATQSSTILESLASECLFGPKIFREISLHIGHCF